VGILYAVRKEVNASGPSPNNRKTGGLAFACDVVFDLRRQMPHVFEACLNHKSGAIRGIGATNELWIFGNL